ncbi:MAG: hypothetical protein RL329_4217, partial [Bacteroidota bacterium]
MKNNFLNKLIISLFKNQSMMKMIFWRQMRGWLLFLGCLCTGTGMAQGSRQSDSLELVALYNATGRESWRTKTNWLTNTPINTWFGVSLTNGRVTSIQLPQNQLIGTIPPNFNLPNLQQLWLFGNQLTGNIPNFNSPNLQQLKLGRNQLTGNIPNFNFPNLEGLYLNNNQLTGSIPNFNFPNLEGLSLSNNQLTASIPNFNFPNLQQLWLSDNQLTSSIPNFNFPNLQYLYLSNNQLTGSIPNFNFPNLQYLYLSNNQLTG